MWLIIGIIHIIDLSNDFFLVDFTHREYHEKALMESLLLIYDHYVTVREWDPNFHSSSAAIDKVVWVRVSRLPIDYYDVKILHYTGDRIDKTIRLNKNMLKQKHAHPRT